MNKNTPHLFERGHTGLIKIHPTKEELAMGKRMASTLKKMLSDCHRSKRTAWAHNSAIGRIEIALQSKGRRQYLNIIMPNGELGDYDVRNFFVLAIQYLTGEYPYLTTNFERIEAVVALPSGRGWYEAVGLV